MSTTSYSEVSSYLSCKRRWHYNYMENLQRVSESESLVDGKIGHAVLEAYYRAHLAGNGEFAEIEASRAFVESGYVFDPDGKRADLEQMLFEYYFPNEPWVQQGYTVLAVEYEVVLRWDDGPDEGYKFIIDLILRSPLGDIIVVDHKFTSMFTTDDDAALLPQIPLYIAGLRGKGLPADYGVYNEINMRKVQKKRPVSDAMRIMWLKPNPTRVVESFRQQVEIAREINERKQLTISESSLTAWRTTSKMTCNMCPYKSLCIGELIGANTDLIRRTEYTQRTKKVFNG